ncbi:MAG: hypothetical protein J2P21_04105 [Chloracidobacterium sp.]|nr:hypothetical protein [Chloracidobacterium sp.]
MNQINKSSLVQALGYGLAGVAAATLVNKTAKRTRPRYSPLGFLSRRRRSQNQIKRTLTGALLSTPLLGSLFGGKIGRGSVKRDLLSSALMGFGAGMGSFATPQRGVLGGILGTRPSRGGSGLGRVGRLLAGGLVAAAASQLLIGKFRDRDEREPHPYDRYTDEQHTHEFRSHSLHDQPGV